MRFLFLDEIYPDAWAAGPHSTLDEWMRFSFGTSNFWDIALRAAGHESETHVLNYDPHWQLKVANYKPDVVVSQNLSVWGAYEGSPLAEFRRFNPKLKLIGMCSYKCDDHVKMGFDVIFSSFPWMIPRCKEIGVRCHYLPLAFGRPVLDRIGELPKERDIPVAFIGGLGSRIWDQGTKTMDAIATALPNDFKWWGYWVDNRSHMSMPLERAWQGPAWGADMYRILARTKICVNRHGEISRGSGNNMRQWESQGMGCYLLTDEFGEIHEGSRYTNPDNAIFCIRDELELWDARTAANAKLGQEWVLNNECYENRVPQFLSVVESL
jgi:hypothetical protein